MVKLNLTSFGKRKKISHYLSHYLRLKIMLSILGVPYTKEFVVVEIVTLVKP